MQATRTNLAARDNDPEDNSELRGRLDLHPPRSPSQRADAFPLSSSEEVDNGADEFFMHFGQDRDKSLPFGEDRVLKYTAFTLTYQAFVGKGLGYDPLRATQTWNMDFWNPPEVILTPIQVL